MNDESPTPPDSGPDASVEARIVAWVLGEASAFEAAELERLCEERPELLVFRRRMRDLHGLFTDAESAEPDLSWRLPAEKRRVLDEIFGGGMAAPAVAPAQPSNEPAIRRNGLRVVFAIAACVAISFSVIRLVPSGHEAEVVLELKPQGMGMTSFGGTDGKVPAQRMSPQFFGTEFDRIKSQQSLSQVVEKLDLASRWNMDKEAAVQRLRDSTVTENTRGTDLLSIKVRDANENDAKEIVREIAHNYRDYRWEIESREAEKGLAELNKAVRDQEAKVEENRKLLATISKTKGIIYRGQDSYYGEGRVDEDSAARGALETFNQLQKDKMQLETQINSLQKMDPDQLMPAVAGLDLPDNTIKSLYPQYLEVQRSLDTLKASGMGEGHPDVKATERQMEVMKRQMDEGLVAVRDTLKNKLDVANNNLKGVEAMKEETREEAITRGLAGQDYVDAKRELEASQALLDSMKLKKIGVETTLKMTQESIVIHEEPEVLMGGVKPASPAFEVASSALAKNSESNMMRDARQQQLAKQSTSPRSRVSAAGASGGVALPEIADSSKMESIRPQGDSFADSAGADLASAANQPVLGVGGSAAGEEERVMAGGRVSPPGGAAYKDGPVLGNTILSAGQVSKKPSLEMAESSQKETAPADMELATRDKKAEAATPPPVLASKVPANPAAPESASSQSDLAKREDIRRKDAVALADSMLSDGREGFAKGDYQYASDKFRDALASLPDTPALAERRKSYTENLSEANISLAMRMRKIGKYHEARQLLDEVAAVDPENKDMQREQGYLDDPVRNNVALADKEGKGVDAVRRGLYAAEGNYNLGKYDEAKKAYEDVLLADANNTAARRGLEKVAAARSDYYRAAYDHTRSELLSQVDKAWELSIPKESSAAGSIAPGDLETLKRLGMQEPASAEDGSLYLMAGTEHRVGEDEPTSELKMKAKDVWPSHPPKPSETAPVDDLIEEREPPYKKDLPSLMEEILTTENPYSTFSLNISDASFQLAKAALAKGELPDPAGIKPEQFYNAVDYGDPAPAANEPVATTIEQAAHPVIPGRNLVRVAVRTGSVGRSAAQPLHLTLLVDQSGSMVREDRRAAMEQAMAQLGTLLTKADLVTVIGFSRTPRLLAEGMTGDQAAKLGGLVNQTASEGGTNLEEAMKLGAELSARHQLAGAQNRIVLFTDGAANLGDAKPERLAEQVKALRQKGIAFDIAGIGADGLNDRLLSELARNGNGRYYVVGDGNDGSFARQLAGAFRPAAENVKIQVIFNPLRVGKYKLIGFEKDRLKTEDFRNDAVDAAELAADEAGVAIYQVEPLAEGRGEIGEVSVRFRNVDGGEMVERSWTIPYDGRATAFDRATPSMQLAGLSLFAAEKLRGGPLADAIDFKQLSNSVAFVKQFYGSSPRVTDMLQVIEKIK